MINKISEFTGSYRFLSNFHVCTILYEGIRYPSTEHAFQAAKCIDPGMRELFLSESCIGAKRLGKAVGLRENWETIKFKVMYDICKYKFSTYPELKKKLLGTDNSTLEENNNHGDEIWGINKLTGKGQNYLGKILMKIRKEF